jgi:hypothetical protein
VHNAQCIVMEAFFTKNVKKAFIKVKEREAFFWTESIDNFAKRTNN